MRWQLPAAAPPHRGSWNGDDMSAVHASCPRAQYHTGSWGLKYSERNKQTSSSEGAVTGTAVCLGRVGGSTRGSGAESREPKQNESGRRAKGTGREGGREGRARLQLVRWATSYEGAAGLPGVVTSGRRRRGGGGSARPAPRLVRGLRGRPAPCGPPRWCDQCPPRCAPGR